MKDVKIKSEVDDLTRGVKVKTVFFHPFTLKVDV